MKLLTGTFSMTLGVLFSSQLAAQQDRSPRQAGPPAFYQPWEQQSSPRPTFPILTSLPAAVKAQILALEQAKTSQDLDPLLEALDKEIAELKLSQAASVNAKTQENWRGIGLLNVHVRALKKQWERIERGGDENPVSSKTIGPRIITHLLSPHLSRDEMQRALEPIFKIVSEPSKAEKQAEERLRQVKTLADIRPYLQEQENATSRTPDDRHRTAHKEDLLNAMLQLQLAMQRGDWLPLLDQLYPAKADATLGRIYGSVRQELIAQQFIKIHRLKNPRPVKTSETMSDYYAAMFAEFCEAGRWSDALTLAVAMDHYGHANPVPDEEKARLRTLAYAKKS